VWQTDLIREDPKPAHHSERGRVWRWRIEPGMEEAFQDLLGWLLSSQRNAEMETADRSLGRTNTGGNGRLMARHPDGSADDCVAATGFRR
jgi:hypothetical protein